MEFLKKKKSTQEVTFSSDVVVKLVKLSAEDSDVVQAAQVSVTGENNPDTDMPRLINALMKDGHGSPFEHNMFKFFVKAPIFVFREWHRHRISSINEMSGRYTELLPEFYTPDSRRPLVNMGTAMRPQFDYGTNKQRMTMLEGDEMICATAWKVYQDRLQSGIAKELARTVLPVSVYSQMYWTVNARSLMNFISLRVFDPTAARVSHPQYEINLGATQVEEYFKTAMPITHAAFVANGRVAP